SGKTVLIETLMGLHLFSGGKVFINDMEVSQLPPEQRQVAYLPQDYGLFPHLGVKDNVLFGARARKFPKELMEQRLKEVSNLLEIMHLLTRPNVSTLSGGERQRIAMARALIFEPAILFLDEPFAAIDENLKRQLQKKLREIKTNLGITIFHVTHDHHEAYYLGDKIGVILSGKLHQVGTQGDLYHNPQSIEVADFLLTRNIFFGVVCEIFNGGTEVLVEVGKRRIRAHPSKSVHVGQNVVIGIRPEEIKIDPVPKDWKVCDESDCNAMLGKIVSRSELFGNFSFESEGDSLRPNLEIDVMKTRVCRDDLVTGAPVKVCLSKKALWILPNENLEKT
ncbi:ABC transporter ATP-binding protein, partial [bacterium]|nr:ABC transporter ATP-binding protein [bacterium]